jgi:uncharacterized DUF497 family protein
VDEVCHSDPLVSETYNDRLRVIGLTNGGQLLTVILAKEAEGIYYAVTARPASRKERQLHRSRKEDKST